MGAGVGLGLWWTRDSPPPPAPTPEASVVELLKHTEAGEDLMKVLSRIGRNVAHQAEFPGTVSIRLDGEHHCGGLLVGNDLVVTAAHCAMGIGSTTSEIAHQRLSVTYGLRLSKPMFGPIGIADTYPHPDYALHPASGTASNDLAALRLTHALSLPLIMPDIAATAPASGEVVRIAGWGINEKNRAVPSLHCVEMAVTKPCGTLSLHPGQACIVDPRNGVTGQSLCQGDSGSPAYNAAGDIVGVVSASLTGCKSTVSTHDTITVLSQYPDFLSEATSHLPPRATQVAERRMDLPTAAGSVRSPQQCRP